MPRAMLPVPMMVMSMGSSSQVRGEAKGDVPRVADDEAALGDLDGEAGGLDARANRVDVGQLHGPAVEAGSVRGRGPDAAALPDVDGEVVVVAAGGHERGRAQVRLELEAEDVAVERQRAVDVAHVQVQMADAQALADVGGGRFAADRREQRVEVQRRRAAVVAEAGRPLARAGDRRPARCRCRPDRLR